MRLTVFYRSVLLAFLAVFSLSACRSKAKEGAAPESGVTSESIETQGALIERHDAGELVFSVEPNGKLKLLVKGTDGKPVQGVTGTLSVKGEDVKAAPTKVTLA